AVGESCTGGLMAARLTERPGSSAYFGGGVVAYSNQTKAELLGVDPALMERYRAVSPEAADAMAAGGLARSGAASGIPITGGPGSPRARLFLALEPRDEYRAALAAWRDALVSGRDDLRPSAPQTLHLTLVFLGYRAEKEIPAIARAALDAVEELEPALLRPDG